MDKIKIRFSNPDWWLYEDDEEVAEQLGCPNPNCGERRMDYLAIADFDNDAIHCESRGVWYRLPWPREQSHAG